MIASASPERPAARLFQFSSAYRIYGHPKENKVALVWEKADLQKLEAALAHPDTEKAKSRHTVLRAG